MGFFSKEFKEAISNTRYWKVKDMAQGEHRFRIVQAPVYGWIDWKDQKPYRYRADKKPKEAFDEENPIRAFVSCYVWDYARKGLFVLEFTQKSIIMALESLSDSEDWGDLTGYDLKLCKEGAGQKVKYTLNPAPHKAMSDEIKAAMKAAPANLEALFSGGDPWNWGLQDSQGSVIDDSDDWNVASDKKTDSRANKGPSEPSEVMSPLEELMEHLILDSIPVDRLQDWLKARAKTKGQTIEATIQACLIPDVLPNFKKAFFKWTQEQVAAV
jgi:hypothetical protein